MEIVQRTNIVPTIDWNWNFEYNFHLIGSGVLTTEGIILQSLCVTHLHIIEGHDKCINFPIDLFFESYRNVAEIQITQFKAPKETLHLTLLCIFTNSGEHVLSMKSNNNLFFLSFKYGICVSLLQ